MVADLLMTTIFLIAMGAENEEIRAVCIFTVSESSPSLRNGLVEYLA